MTNDLHYSASTLCPVVSKRTSTYTCVIVKLQLINIFWKEAITYMQMYLSLKRHLLLLYTYKNYIDVKYE